MVPQKEQLMVQLQVLLVQPKVLKVPVLQVLLVQGQLQVLLVPMVQELEQLKVLSKVELVLVPPLAQQVVVQAAVGAQVLVLLMVQAVHLFHQVLVVAFSP
jgi:hypothetical protein